MTRKMSRRAFTLLLVVVSAILSYLYWMPLLESKAYFLHDDMVHFDNIKLWIKQHQPLWGEIISTNNIHNSIRLSRYFILKIYSLFSTSFEGFIKLWFYIITLVAILANTYVFQRFLSLAVEGKRLTLVDRVLAYIAAATYTFSFWTIYTSTGHALFTGWTIFPVVFYFGLLFQKARTLTQVVKYSVYFAIFSFFFLITPHTLIYALITISVFTLLGKGFLDSIKKLIVFTSLFILLNLYWIMPVIKYLRKVSILLPYNKVVAETLNVLSRNAGPRTLLTTYDPWKHFDVVTYYFGHNILGLSLVLQSIITAFILFYLAFYLYKYPRGARRTILSILILVVVSVIVKGGMVFEPSVYRSLVSLPFIGWIFRVPYRAELLFFPSILIAVLYAFQKNRWLSLFLVIGLVATNFVFTIPWRWLYLETFYQNPVADPGFEVSHIYSLTQRISIEKVFVVNPYDYSIGKCSWCIDLHFKDLKQIPRYYPVLSSPVQCYDYVFMNNFGKMLYLWFWYTPSSVADRANLLSRLGINAYLIRKDFTLNKHTAESWNAYVSYLQAKVGCVKLEDKYNKLWVCRTNSGPVNVSNNVVISTNLVHLLSQPYPFIYLNYINEAEKDVLKTTPVMIIDYRDAWLEYLPLLLGRGDAVIIKPAMYTSIRSAGIGWAYANEFYSTLTFNKPANILMGSRSWIGDYGYGVVFTWARNVTLMLRFNLMKGGSYRLLCRVFENNHGSSMELGLDKVLIRINTKSPTNRFTWKDLGVINLKKGLHTLILRNIKGFNAVNVIMLIPNNKYVELKRKAAEIFQGKKLIYILEAEHDLHYQGAKVVENSTASGGGVLVFARNGRAWQYINIVREGKYRLILKGKGVYRLRIGNNTITLNPENGTAYTKPLNLEKRVYYLEIDPLASKSLLYNPSFEEVLQGLPKGWSVPHSQVFNVSLDKGYSGSYSLRVETSSSKKATWSWIRSIPVKVKPGEKYLIITHMKIFNTKSSHIVVEGYLARERKWIQLAQVPPGREGTGSHDWKEYSDIVIIPDGVTMIRIDLNAGWVLDKTKGNAITWFDDIWIAPLSSSPLLDYLIMYTDGPASQPNINNEGITHIETYRQDGPTKFIIRINAGKPFMLIFREAYDPLWEASIYKNGRLVKKIYPLLIYGVINGFWINETGNLTIVIRYVPQDWFELGLKISATTFALMLFYLFWDWRRGRGDRWALRLEAALKSVAKSLSTRLVRRAMDV